jgi:hypothetical protein
MEEICKNQNLSLSDLAIFDIVKDKNGKTISIAFLVDELKSLEVFQKFVHFTLFYPQKRQSVNPEIVAPPYPIIIIVFPGDEGTGPNETNIVAEFEDDAWRWEKQF